MNLITTQGPSIEGFLSFLASHTTAYVVALVLAVVVSAIWACLTSRLL